MNLHRVKLYRLNPEGNWDDKGTGFVSLEPNEVRTCGYPWSWTSNTHTHGSQNTNRVALVVTSEQSVKTMFAHDIADEVDIYNIQGGAWHADPLVGSSRLPVRWLQMGP
jgi:hypothetical protein